MRTPAATKAELVNVVTEGRLHDIRQFRWSKNVSFQQIIALKLVQFSVDELLPPGKYGVRVAARETSRTCEKLKQSLINYPIEVLFDFSLKFHFFSLGLEVSSSQAARWGSSKILRSRQRVSRAHM